MGFILQEIMGNIYIFESFLYRFFFILIMVNNNNLDMQIIQVFLFLIKIKKIKEKLQFLIELKDQKGLSIIYIKIKVFFC